MPPEPRYQAGAQVQEYLDEVDQERAAEAAMVKLAEDTARR